MIGLSLLLKNGLVRFAELTGRPELLPKDSLLTILLLLLGLLLCFLGFWCYRGLLAGFAYAAVVVLWCTTLKEQMSWGELVAGFSMTGCVLGFLAFQWKALGTVFLPVLLAGTATYALYPDIWVAIAVGASVFLLCYGLPVYGVCFFTAAFGAQLIYEVIGWSAVRPLPWYMAVLLCLAGLAVQLLVGAKHKMNMAIYRGWAERLRRRLADKRQEEAMDEDSI